MVKCIGASSLDLSLLRRRSLLVGVGKRLFCEDQIIGSVSLWRNWGFAPEKSGLSMFLFNIKRHCKVAYEK